MQEKHYSKRLTLLPTTVIMALSQLLILDYYSSVRAQTPGINPDAETPNVQDVLMQQSMEQLLGGLSGADILNPNTISSFPDNILTAFEQQLEDLLEAGTDFPWNEQPPIGDTDLWAILTEGDLSPPWNDFPWNEQPPVGNGDWTGSNDDLLAILIGNDSGEWIDGEWSLSGNWTDGGWPADGTSASEGDNGTLLDLGQIFAGTSDPIEGSIGANITELLGGILGSFGGIASDSQIFANAEGALAGTNLDGTRGVLGIPDPEIVDSLIDVSPTGHTEEALGTKQGGEGSPVVKNDAKVQFNADLTKASAINAALTNDAQEQLATNIALAQRSLQQSQALAEDSENQDVSQNILRNLSVQTALSQQTDSLIAIDAQRRQRDDAMRNVVLSDALRELHKERVSERRMDASAYSFAITHGGLLALPGVWSDE